MSNVSRQNFENFDGTQTVLCRTAENNQSNTVFHTFTSILTLSFAFTFHATLPFAITFFAMFSCKISGEFLLHLRLLALIFFHQFHRYSYIFFKLFLNLNMLSRTL